MHSRVAECANDTSIVSVTGLLSVQWKELSRYTLIRT